MLLRINNYVIDEYSLSFIIIIIIIIII